MALPPNEFTGYARLTIDAIVGVTDIVESMHATIARRVAPLGGAPAQRARGVSGFVYGSVRGITRGVGAALDALLRNVPLRVPLDEATRDAVHAALNGICGDHLERTANPIAMRLSVRPDAAFPPSARLLVLVHGLCMNDRQWLRNGHDHGAALARSLGYTPVYVRYNSGRHVAANGRELAAQLEALVRGWPVPLERLALLGHSMGGLVLRSACAEAERAGHAWRRRVDDLICLGTPHHGAPLERAGHVLQRGLRLSAYSAPLAALGAARSAGITDLRDGRVAEPEQSAAPPLPAGVRCYAIGALRGRDPANPLQRWRGDGLVPLDSALGVDLGFAPDRRHVVTGADHFDLLDHADVFATLRDWLTRSAEE